MRLHQSVGLLPAILPVALVLPGCALSQEPVVLSEQGMCTDCISLTDQITIGADPDAPLAGESRYVTVDGLGRYWISQGDRIEVFDSLGSHIRTFGGPGQGPEEFSTVLSMVPTPDGNILLFDGLNRRASVVSTGFDFLSSFTIDGPGYDALFLGDETLVANQRISSSRELGFPIHMYAFPTGDKLASIGKQPGINVYPARGNPMRRAIEPRTSTSILAAPRTAPRVEEWSLFGNRLLAEWTRDVSWFQPYDEPEPYSLQHPPQPMLDGLHIDSDGLVWVLFWVAAEDWKDHMEMKSFAGEMRLQSIGNDPVYDTVIEVWDLNREVVRASVRVPETIHGFLPNGRMYGVANLPDGTPLTRTWRVETRF